MEYMDIQWNEIGCSENQLKFRLSQCEKPLHFSWKIHENPMKWDEIIHDSNWSYWCAKGVPHCGFQLSSSSPWGGWPCPCPDRARAAGWVSTTTKQGHIDARLAWTLGGEMPAEWLQAKARQWAVRGLSLSTRCGIHPDADPQPGLALLWMGKAAQPPSVKHYCSCLHPNKHAFNAQAVCADFIVILSLF